MFRPVASWRLLLATAVAGLALAGAVGCGDDDADDGGGAAADGETASETTTVSVGVIPVANLAPFYVGMEQGFFEEQGLELDVSSSLSGAPQNVPRLLKGDLQFVATAWLSLMLSRDEGLPVVAIAPGDNAGTTADEDYCHVITAADGPQSLEQLAGTTIAINTLKNVGEVSMDATLDQAGVNLDSIEYVQLPWPEMGSALRNDRVDAGWVCEPFLTQLKGEMNVNDLGPSQIKAAPNLPISVYVTSEQYLEQNPDVVRRFQAAIEESNAYAQDNPEEARAALPSFTDISDQVADEMILPTWDTSYDEEAVQALADQSEKYGILNQPVQVDEIMAPFPLEQDGQ